MSKVKFIVIPLILLIFVSLAIINCGGGKKSTSPENVDVSFQGQLSLIGNDRVSPDNISISFGHDETSPDSIYTYDIQGHQGIPGIMIASKKTDSIPILMGIIANPQKDLVFNLDLNSTAIAMIFMNPFVCVSTSEDAELAIEIIENLPEFNTFKSLLQTKLTANPRALVEIDNALYTALADVVIAFFDEYPDLIGRNYSNVKTVLPKLAKPNKEGVVVSPGSQVSGHILSHTSGNNFEITNAYGRWAYCKLPDGKKFLLSPNGQMFDFIKDGVPWAPSKTQFSMTVTEAPDTQIVNVYGFGWKDDSDNLWDNLTSEEQDLAFAAGGLTVIFEFCGHILSLYGNSKSFDIQTGLKADYDDHWGIQLLSFLTGDAKFMTDVVLKLKQKKYGELFYDVANTVLYKFVYDAAFREFWLKKVGYEFSEEMLGKMSTMVIAPAVAAPIAGVMIGNNLTSVMKTWVGFTSSRFKTTFKVWKEVGDFGNVQGGVFDKDEGTPIEGAVINLTGDGQNPIDTWHTYSSESDGGFYFENILIGQRGLTATKEGYKAGSVDITVVKNATITKNIELEKITGTVSGRILNDIYIGNEKPDSLFDKDITLRVREIGGENRVFSYYENDGKYLLKLFPGNWWIIADHEYYHNDSVQVTIEEDETTTPRDLIMDPILEMSASMRVDMDGDGNYEINFNYEPTIVIATEPIETYMCPTGTTTDVIGIIGWYEPTNDYLSVILNPTELSSSTSMIDLGTISDAICANSNKGGAIEFSAGRYYCTEDDGDTRDLIFRQLGGPYFGQECYCGVTNLGSLMFYTYEGEELGDLIHGSVMCHIPAWKNCDCEEIDTDNDGVNDDWEVTCAIAEIDIEFKVLVGTTYKRTQANTTSELPTELLQELLDN